MPKLFEKEASGKNLARAGVRGGLSLNGERCVRLIRRSVGEYTAALTE